MVDHRAGTSGAHSTKDKDFVERLAAALKSAAFEPCCETTICETLHHAGFRFKMRSRDDGMNVFISWSGA